MLLACSLLLQLLPTAASESSRPELRSVIALAPAVSAPTHRHIARERQRAFDADSGPLAPLASLLIEPAPRAALVRAIPPRVVDPSPYDAQAPPRV